MRRGPGQTPGWGLQPRDFGTTSKSETHPPASVSPVPLSCPKNTFSPGTMQIEALPYKPPANPYHASSARAPSSIAAPSPVSPLRRAARQVLPGCRDWRVWTALGARIWLLAAFWARSAGMRLSLQGQGWSRGTGKPSLGIISAAARGSCLHPDKCWAPYHGAGVAPVPLHPPPSSTAACSAPSQQQDQCIPWDTHIGMSVSAPNPGFL